MQIVLLYVLFISIASLCQAQSLLRAGQVEDHRNLDDRTMRQRTTDYFKNLAMRVKSAFVVPDEVEANDDVIEPEPIQKPQPIASTVQAPAPAAFNVIDSAPAVSNVIDSASNASDVNTPSYASIVDNTSAMDDKVSSQDNGNSTSSKTMPQNWFSTIGDKFAAAWSKLCKISRSMWSNSKDMVAQIRQYIITNWQQIVQMFQSAFARKEAPDSSASSAKDAAQMQKAAFTMKAPYTANRVQNAEQKLRA